MHLFLSGRDNGDVKWKNVWYNGHGIAQEGPELYRLQERKEGKDEKT